MHQPLTDLLESYLHGSLPEAEARTVDAHLAVCAECRNEAGDMRGQASLLRTLRIEEELTPSPGFYARIIATIETEQVRSSFWSLFLDPIFGKRLVYATATMVLLLGVFLVASESNSNQEQFAKAPEQFLSTPASQRPAIPALGEDIQHDRDAVLVTLASYSD